MNGWLDGTGLAGLLLVGAALAGVVLIGPTAFVSPAIWGGPPTVALRLIADHRLVWRAANVGFAVATVMTAAGLYAASDAVGDPGASLATAAAVAFTLAAGLWLVTLAIRLAITPGVAAAFVATGTIDPDYAPLARLGYALFVAFIFIGSASLVALGVAIVVGGALDVVLGWAIAVAGILIAGSYVGFGDTLPAFIYMPTTALGIVLLSTVQ